MRAAGTGADGARLRALIVILWRAGLRIGEALDLAETDLDASRGAVLVRRGKGGRRREVGMDRWAWSQLEPWIAVRRQLPVGALSPPPHPPNSQKQTPSKKAPNKNTQQAPAPRHPTPGGPHRRVGGEPPCRAYARWFARRRPPNPACGFHRTGLSTGHAVADRDAGLGIGGLRPGGGPACSGGRRPW